MSSADTAPWYLTESRPPDAIRPKFSSDGVLFGHPATMSDSRRAFREQAPLLKILSLARYPSNQVAPFRGHPPCHPCALMLRRCNQERLA
jgi:hypothetical protein